MKLTFNNDVLSLAAETPEEQAICTYLMAADGHVFQLHCTTDRGFAFTELGPEADACRAPLNITRSVEPRFQPISNLAHTPFELDGERYASVEGFWQSLKVTDAAARRQLADLFGPEAKGRGAAAGQPATIDYDGDSIPTGSPEHWQLMRRACEAKFNQHKAARSALAATGQRWLTHKVRHDSRTIPGVVMAQIWMDVRATL